jgi:hypothetical protein
MTGMLMALLFASLFAAATIFFFARRSGGAATDVYQKLLRKSLGDRTQVERLIEAERRRHPEATREKLMRHALERWERHLR